MVIGVPEGCGHRLGLLADVQLCSKQHTDGVIVYRVNLQTLTVIDRIVEEGYAAGSRTFVGRLYGWNLNTFVH